MVVSTGCHFSLRIKVPWCYGFCGSTVATTTIERHSEALRVYGSRVSFFVISCESKRFSNVASCSVEDLGVSSTDLRVFFLRTVLSTGCYFSSTKGNVYINEE